MRSFASSPPRSGCSSAVPPPPRPPVAPAVRSEGAPPFAAAGRGRAPSLALIRSSLPRAAGGSASCFSLMAALPFGVISTARSLPPRPPDARTLPENSSCPTASPMWSALGPRRPPLNRAGSRPDLRSALAAARSARRTLPLLPLAGPGPASKKSRTASSSVSPGGSAARGPRPRQASSASRSVYGLSGAGAPSPVMPCSAP